MFLKDVFVGSWLSTLSMLNEWRMARTAALQRVIKEASVRR